jgi:glycosyl transferase family 4
LRRSILRRVAGLLGPPRDEALVDLALDARNLLLGRAKPEPEDPLAVLLRGARQSIARRDFDAALAEADRLAQGMIQLRRDAARRRGAIAAVARAMGEGPRTTGGTQLSAVERGWLRSAVESDPRWLPWIPPAAARPIEPRDNVVLHIRDVSLPYADDEDAVHIHANAVGEREAGLEPIVVTALGFPRTAGTDSFAPVDVIDGVSYHRLDAGPGYDYAAPSDDYLSDYAWLVARLAERERPQIVHVWSSRRGHDAALVGLALRARLDVPLVYEVRSLGDPVSSPAAAARDASADTQGPAVAGDSESIADAAERVIAIGTRCMRDADAVVVMSEPMAEEIVTRGIPLAKVHVIPDAVEGAERARNAERHRELYGSLLGRPIGTARHTATPTAQAPAPVRPGRPG